MQHRKTVVTVAIIPVSLGKFKGDFYAFFGSHVNLKLPSLIFLRQ